MNLRDAKTPTNELIRFFLVAVLWSWLWWLPGVLASAGWISLPDWLDSILSVTAVFGPAFAAFCLTASREGKPAAAALWRRGWSLNFDKTWLVPAVLVMPVVGALTVLALTALGIEIAWAYSPPLVMIAPIFLLIYLGAMGEEYGWRGYALDRLQSIWSPLQASLLLGFIWGVWHLPLHFIDGSVQSVIPIWQYVLQTIVLSVLYTWLYNRTRRSILVAIVFHAFGNLAGAYLPTWTSSAGRWINLLLIIAAIVGLAFYTGMKKYRQA